MIPWLKVLAILSDLMALLRAWREREAGRNDAILQQKAANDDAMRKANQARSHARLRDSSADGLRADDGHRRD